ncbi:MAG: EamA family transporter, partial [Cyclobacteriaceae bacterium]|nr:EamA family transporter [Cyclobacteriaceae bacterium]
YAKIRKINLTFSIGQHLRMLLQGCLLFGFNYWMVYRAEEGLNSALMAVLFSGIIFTNILFSRIFLGHQARPVIFFGAVMGVAGTILIFYEQLKDTAWENLPIQNIVYGAVAVLFASLGNVTSAANQKQQIPVVPSNGFGMTYGALVMFAVAALGGSTPTIDLSFAYMGSLLYLSFFGSIAAFGAYLSLIGNIGPGRAAYVLVVIPVIALVISTLFEGYTFAWYALAGVVLILAGNLTITKK